MILGIHDKHIPRAVASYRLRPIELALYRRPPVPAIPLRARSRNRRDNPRRVNPAYRIPLPLAHIDIPPAVSAHRARPENPRLNRQPAVARMRLFARPRECADNPACDVQPPYALILHIRDKQPAPAVQRAVIRLPHPRRHRRPAISPIPHAAIPRHRADYPAPPRYLTHSWIEPLQNIHIPIGIRLNRVNLINPRRRRKPAIPRMPRLARPRDSVHHPRPRIHPAYRIIKAVRDIQIPPRRIKLHMKRVIHSRRRSRPSIPAIPLLPRPRDARDDCRHSKFPPQSS